MSVPLYMRSPLCLAKRLRVDGAAATLPLLLLRGHSLNPPGYGRRTAAPFATAAGPPFEGKDDTDEAAGTAQSEAQYRNDGAEDGDEGPRLPRSVQAVYLRPLRRTAKYGVPSCDLQLRSYNVRNVEFFADFALRAAYYLDLPARGPVPLPRLVERWTVTRSNFVHKKSQENFERITLRRLIQIQDGHPDTVQLWLAFLKKHAYYGIGMKANVWEHERLGVGKSMDVSLENLKQVLEPKWAHFGRKKTLETSEKVMEMMNSERFRRIDDGPLSR